MARPPKKLHLGHKLHICTFCHGDIDASAKRVDDLLHTVHSLQKIKYSCDIPIPEVNITWDKGVWSCYLRCEGMVIREDLYDEYVTVQENQLIIVKHTMYEEMLDRVKRILEDSLKHS